MITNTKKTKLAWWEQANGNQQCPPFCLFLFHIPPDNLTTAPGQQKVFVSRATMAEARAKHEAALTGCFNRWAEEVSETKTPQEMYEQKQGALRARCDDRIQGLRKHEIETDNYEKDKEELFRLVVEIHELETHPEQALVALEQQYLESLDEVDATMLCDLLDAAGDTLSNPRVQNRLRIALLPRQSTPATDAAGRESRTRTDAPPSPESVENPTPEPLVPGNDTTPTSNAAPETNAASEVNAVPTINPTPEMNSTPETNPAPETSSAPEMNPAPEMGPPPTPNTNPPLERPTLFANRIRKSVGGRVPARLGEEPRRSNVSAASPASAKKVPAVTPSTQNGGNQNDASPPTTTSKPPTTAPQRTPRKRASTTTNDQQQQKRQRHFNESPVFTEETIDFAEVFQDGKAQVKYLIWQYPPTTGGWYIFECKEHGQHFVNNPIKGAAKHLSSQGHGLSREHALAVRTLGTRVLNCDAALAEKNNAMAKEAFSKNLGLPWSESQETQNRADKPTQHLDRGKQTESREVPDEPVAEIVHPVVGDIYAVSWRGVKSFYPALVLPWTSFNHFSWKTALLRETPECYLFDKAKDPYPRGWAKGYESGGPLVNERMYPVIYFGKGDMFPGDADVGWAHVSKFKEFDENDTTVYYREKVAEYILDEDERLQVDPEASQQLPIVISDDCDSDNPDTGMGMRPRGFREEPVCEDCGEKHDKNPTTGERGEGANVAERDTRRDNQGSDQEQVGQSSHGENRTRDNDPASSPKLVNAITDEEPQAFSGPLHQLPQPTTDAEEQRGVPSEEVGQSSQAPPRGNTSQPQHGSLPQNLTDEDLVSLAAQAMFSTPEEVLDDERPRPQALPKTGLERTQVNNAQNDARPGPRAVSSQQAAFPSELLANAPARQPGFFDPVTGFRVGSQSEMHQARWFAGHRI